MDHIAQYNGRSWYIGSWRSLVKADDLLARQRLWATVDSPWVTTVDRNAVRDNLQPLRRLDPPVVLCTHLPPAHGTAEQLLNTLETAPDADPFVGPDQAALESMLAQMERGQL